MIGRLYNKLVSWYYNNAKTKPESENRFEIYEGPWDGQWIKYKGRNFHVDDKGSVTNAVNPDGSYRLVRDQYSYRQYYVWMSDKTFKFYEERYPEYVK